MNGLQKIIQQIEEKSEKRRDELLQEAREEAEERKESAKKEAEREKEKIIEKGKREAEINKRRILAGVRQDNRQRKLSIKEDVIKEVWEKAQDRLFEIKEDEDEYRSVLKHLIKEGAKALNGGELEVQVSKEDEGILSQEELEGISENISDGTDNKVSIDVSPELPSSKGGVVIERKRGNVSIDNTFEARIKRMKGSLRPKLAEILFE